MQSKRYSLFESISNVIVGYFVALSTQLAVFPLFGIHIPISSNLGIGFIFTLVSLVRSYLLRRLYNRIGK